MGVRARLPPLPPKGANRNGTCGRTDTEGRDNPPSVLLDLYPHPTLGALTPVNNHPHTKLKTRNVKGERGGAEPPAA